MALIQSLQLVYRIFIFEIYSLVINIAILVNKAVIDEITIPAPGLIKPIVKLPITEPDPIKKSVTIHKTFFLIQDFYFFLQNSLSI